MGRGEGDQVLEEEKEERGRALRGKRSKHVSSLLCGVVNTRLLGSSLGDRAWRERIKVFPMKARIKIKVLFLHVS